MSSPLGRALCLLGAALLVCSCRSVAEEPAPRQTIVDAELARKALESYVEIAFATYHDSVEGVELLAARVQDLLAAPSAESLEASRRAWLSARVAYAQSEVFRFYEGPIDQVELWVNTWPIDEGLVESDGAEGALGIVQDVARYPELTTQLLKQLNARDGETAISTGYHVIEFLLWGRDANPSGAGQRSYRDFVVERSVETGPKASAAALLAERRGTYLTLAVALLAEQLREVRSAFAPASHNYRALFRQAPPAHGLYRALKGMAKLSGPELAGERMTVPYETKNQEHEHSCFSDSTHADLLGNALGVENVCLGRYRRSAGSPIRGTGICEVIRRAAPALGAALTQQVSASVRLVATIPAPFDQAILGDDGAPARAAIQRAIGGLRKQAELLEQARAALALSEPISLAVPR